MNSSINSIVVSIDFIFIFCCIYYIVLFFPITGYTLSNINKLIPITGSVDPTSEIGSPTFFFVDLSIIICITLSITVPISKFIKHYLDNHNDAAIPALIPPFILCCLYYCLLKIYNLYIIYNAKQKNINSFI
jgi:hypothetical protein